MFLTSLTQRNSLTPYPKGSISELWWISFPLMISLMSVSLMFFLDRLLLSRYSLEALNAAANAGMLIQLMQFWCISTACIAEVFVGRYNGAGRKEKLGKPVWQMIWLSLGTIFWFIPAGLFLGPYFFHADPNASMEIDYFKILMCFGPAAALSASLSSFYIGQGRVKFVTFVMILSNVTNVSFDYILIWGWGDWIPSYGIQGAAYATGIAMSLQAVVLFCDFIKKDNRLNFGTGNWKFSRKLVMRSLKIGLPNAIAHSLELLAWVTIFHLMTQLGSDYITVVTISQSICFLFSFITEGVSKGATAIASNLIGAQQHDLIWKLLKSGVILYLISFIFLGVFFTWHPEWILTLFLGDRESISPATLQTIHSALFWVWIFYLFDGLNWFLIGLLTAAGDTLFIMKVGGAGPWLVALLPIYLFVFKLGAPPEVTWMLIAFYVMATCGVYLMRFRSEKWKEVILAKA